MTTKAVIKCFAKINLFLDVLCKRDDGYHNIETIFQSISLNDVMEIALASAGMKVDCDHPSVPADKTNLACKAFLAFAEAVGYDGGVDIKIRKNIPPGSGLGGGSSNAAATLVALNHMLQVDLSDDRLREIGRGIGADVPFFISGGLAAAWGIGDKMTRLPPLPEGFIVVAVPSDISVSTARAYDLVLAPDCEGPAPGTFLECGDGLRESVEALDSRGRSGDGSGLASILYNAFEKPIFRQYPKILDLKELLLIAGADATLMSGSGSAVFGLSASLEQANEIKDIVEQSFDCDCFSGMMIPFGWQLGD